MKEDKKKQLFPYFAYLHSKQINPNRYGDVSDFEKWSTLLDEHPEDMKAIIESASELPDEEWDNLEIQYNSENVQSAKNGAKLKNLKKLQEYKKGKSLKRPKKCGCGCDMIQVKEKGGKLIVKCSCGCTPSKKIGGTLNPLRGENLNIIGTFDDVPMVKQKWERRLKSKNLLKFKK